MTNLDSGVAVPYEPPKSYTFKEDGGDGRLLFVLGCEWRKGGVIRCDKPADWYAQAGLFAGSVCHDHLVGACRNSLESTVRLVGRKPKVRYVEVMPSWERPVTLADQLLSQGALVEYLPATVRL